MGTSIKNMPVEDRPYEKLIRSGTRALTDTELLAVIIRSGTRQESALNLAQRLLTVAADQGGLFMLQSASIEELQQIPGIGQVKALQIKAALELGNRVLSQARPSERRQIRKPDDAIHLLENELRFLPREELHVILLDIRNRVIRTCRLSEGGLAASVLYPRDLFREAVKANAAALILAHNHPSGDATPSKEDIETTRRFMEIGDMMGVRVMDHVVIASGGAISLKQQGLI